MKKKLVKIIEVIKKKFMWNSTINSLKISFFPNCLAFYSSVKTIQIKGYGTNSDYLTAFALGAIPLGVIIAFSRTLIKERRNLSKKKKIDAIGQLYPKIETRSRISSYAFMYWPISLLRMVVFCSMPLCFNDSGRQI